LAGLNAIGPEHGQKDFTIILVMAERSPEFVLNEDEQLQMICDSAVTRSGQAD
jgi:hypothetical protein